MGLSSSAYVPTLKAREAEIKAALKAPRGLDVTPVFELQRATPAAADDVTRRQIKRKSTLTDASYFLDDVARLWREPLYVDITRVAANATERAAWWDLLAALNKVSTDPCDLMPVLVPTDDMTSLAAAARVAASTGRAAFRLPMAQVSGNPAALAGSTATLAETLGVPVGDIDVILDWADKLERYTLDNLQSDTAATIAALGGQHGQLITSGTPNGAQCVQVGDWHPTRREWWLWLRLAHAGHDLAYGDYALYQPADPVPASPKYGHLRYSSGDKMHVHRRAMPAAGGALGAAFKACCDHVVTQPHWLGDTFSGADARIFDIANNADKESSAGKWRQLAAEHHFALVAQQLAAPPAAPAPGTP